MENFRMVELPKKITPCPIVESIFELRFNSLLPEDAIFGVLYSHLKNEFSKFEQLPVLQLPPTIRSQDPNLRYSPHYRSKKDNFVIQIGPRSLSFSNVEGYAGWDAFSKKIYSVYKQIESSEVINKIERLGLRYVNILEGVNIFENSNFTISLNDDLISRKTKVTTELPFEKGACSLTVASDTEAQLGNKKSKIIGSVVDIDVALNIVNNKDIKTDIEYAHNVEKELFFSLLKKEYIKTLKPEY